MADQDDKKIEKRAGRVRLKHMIPGGHYEITGKGGSVAFSQAKGQEQDVSRELADYLLKREFSTWSNSGSRTVKKQFEEVRPASPAQS